jgi:hypothetical protein
MEGTIQELLLARGSRYGSFSKNASISNGLYSVVLEHKDNHLSDAHLEAIKMIFHKIARMVAGDPYYLDNVDDIIGYATLLKDYIIESENS